MKTIISIGVAWETGQIAVSYSIPLKDPDGNVVAHHQNAIHAKVGEEDKLLAVLSKDEVARWTAAAWTPEVIARHELSLEKAAAVQKAKAKLVAESQGIDEKTEAKALKRRQDKRDVAEASASEGN